MYKYKNADFFEKVGLVPVIVLSDANDAVPLARKLCKKGIPIAEVTFRTAAAADAIRRISVEVDEVLVGAGTVHSVETARLAVECGAKFIITAGFNEPVVDWCIDKGIDIYPGCSTPSDLEKLLLKGLSVAKFFPAEAAGGVEMLKAFSGPYGEVKFIPTGGITEANVADYRSLPNVIACGGSWMAK